MWTLIILRVYGPHYLGAWTQIESTRSEVDSLQTPIKTHTIRPGIDPPFRPLPQHSIPHTTPLPSNAAISMLMRTEAVSFVDNVKSQFEHDPRKYQRFL